MKAFFAIVVYPNPKVCVENPMNEHKPKTFAPAINDSFDKFSLFLYKKLCPVFYFPMKNLIVKVCIALNPAVNYNFMPINPLPQIIAILNNPISPMYFFI